MQPAATPLLEAVKEYTSNFFKNHVPAEYVFHDITHTQQVVASAIEIAEELNMNTAELEMLQIAAWFHDIGYDQGQEGHEARSADYAGAFLTEKNYDEDKIRQVQSAINATKLPHNPKSLYDKVLCDADMSHLGKKTYWERSSRIRQELMLTKGITMTEEEWVDFELSFLLKHQYITPIGQVLYDKRKAKNIKELRKQKMRLNPSEALTMDEVSEKETEQNDLQKVLLHSKTLTDKEIKLAKEKALGRGVETMYRTTYQTHNNLSALADHKANMMLSINTICISIIASTLVPKVIMNGGYHKLIVPTVIFLIVCLISMIYATLSTRPKITQGHVSREDITAKKSNLLFFGNFHNMQLSDFQWGMNKMIHDRDFLYSTMSRDIFFLGVVLAKKYQLLSVCYNVFMYGLILTVLAFTVAFMF
jgi:predicted metal-dependent HD superfamily phosphohydrolase